MTRQPAPETVEAMGGRWLAAGTLPADPYPCRCHSPQGCRRGNPRFHCPDWGRTVEDHLPVACCARKPTHPNQLEQ